MGPTRTLRLRRDVLAALDTGELREVGGMAAAVTPDCTPLVLTIPVARCLSEILAECPR